MVFLQADLRQPDSVITELIRNSQNLTEIQGMTSLEVSNYMSVCACGRDHVWVFDSVPDKRMYTCKK